MVTKRRRQPQGMVTKRRRQRWAWLRREEDRGGHGYDEKKTEMGMVTKRRRQRWAWLRRGEDRGRHGYEEKKTATGHGYEEKKTETRHVYGAKKASQKNDTITLITKKRGQKQNTRLLKKEGKSETAFVLAGPGFVACFAVHKT